MWAKLRALWGRAAGWTKASWLEVRPTAEAARGARWGAGLLVLAMALYLGAGIRAGLGTAGDIAAVTAAASLALFLGAGVLWVVLWMIQKLPRFTLALLVVSVLLAGFSSRGPLLPLAAVLFVAGAGACLASLIWARMSRLRLVVTWVLLALSLGGAGAMAFLFLWDGRDKDYADAPLSKQPKVEALNAPDPSAPGPRQVVSFTYGAGTDRSRPEYGAQVGLKSRTVDGSKVVKNREGWRGKVRKWQWGFDNKQLPLNGRVWMPEGAGPFPIALVVHGNHHGQEYSDPGYAYLGELLASRGFILVSVDENFLNGHWSGDYEGSETAARGWLLLEHLKLWREWGKTKGHRLEGKADLTRVATMGHSRGGEAAATAALFNTLAALPGDARQRFDYGFGIRAVVAIAPADGQYKPAGVPRPLKDVNYFVIHGGNDFDVSSFAGARQYGRVAFSPGFDGFKAELWIYRANHGQFNTVWGRWDGRGPGAWLMNLKPLISGDQQRQIAKVYIAAFLEAALNGRGEYRPLFEDYRRGARWLPDTTYVNRFQDASFRAVAGFDEDVDPGTSTAGLKIRGEKLAAWSEERIPSRWGDRGTNGVLLAWREPGVFTVELPGWKLGPASVLEFSLADRGEAPPKEEDAKKGEEKKGDGKKKEDGSRKPEEKKPKAPLDLTVELEDAAGKRAGIALSRMGPVYAPLKIGYAKLKLPGDDRKPSEPVLQRYRAPLSLFGGVDPARLKALRFRFDQSKEGFVVLDDVGFSGQER